MNEEVKKASRNFWTMVRAEVEQKSPEVKSAVLSHYVEAEINGRVQRAVLAIKTLGDLDKRLRKLRPDQEQYDASGKLVSETYSKAKLEERRKVEEQQARIETALEEVFEKGQFEKLMKLEFQAAAGDAA
jgi:hypothetical protein